MIAIVDLGIGNLASVRSGFARVDTDTVVISRASDWDDLFASDGESVTGVVLPGVGAFGDAMFQLKSTGLLQVVRQVARQGRPLLGICLGMQLLFTCSEEHGNHIGLGLLPGKVVRFRGHMKVPHMGWNTLDQIENHPLLAGISKDSYVYFVHAYHAVLDDEANLLARCTYANVQVPAIVGRNAIYGTQFHPEKSGVVGERLLKNFAAICEAWRVGQGGSGDDAKSRVYPVSGH